MRFDPELVDTEWSDLSIVHHADEGPGATEGHHRDGGVGLG